MSQRKASQASYAIAMMLILRDRDVSDGLKEKHDVLLPAKTAAHHVEERDDYHEDAWTAVADNDDVDNAEKSNCMLRGSASAVRKLRNDEDPKKEPDESEHGNELRRCESNGYALGNELRRCEKQWLCAWRQYIAHAVPWMRLKGADFHRHFPSIRRSDLKVGIFGWILIVSIGACCLASQGACVCLYICGPGGILQFEEFAGVSMLDMLGWFRLPEGYSPTDSEASQSSMPEKHVSERSKKLVPAMKPLIRREARVMMVLPLILLAFLRQGTCADGAPSVVYIVYLFFLVCARIIETRLVWVLQAAWTAYMTMVIFSTLDHAYWFTDGLFPAQAYLCDEQMTKPFAHTLQKNPLAFLVGVIHLIRFWGLALLLFSAAAFSQQAQASTWNLGSAQSSMAFSADKAAFLGVASICEAVDIEDKPELVGVPSLREVSSAVVKVLVENCLQLRLQASGFAILFIMTTRWAKRYCCQWLWERLVLYIKAYP